jgi:hypothetical protein
MSSPQPPDPLHPAGSPLGSGYFIVRVRRISGAAFGDVSGVVERLGTGEKREFRSSSELAQVVAEWGE